MEYFYATANGEQKGPVSVEELQALNLPGETLVWREGFSQWQPLNSVVELRVGGAPAPVTPFPVAPASPAVTSTVATSVAGPVGGPAGSPTAPLGYQQLDPSQRTNGMAIAALVLGILSCVLLCCYLNVITGVLAIIFSKTAKKQITNGQGTGLPMANAGYVCGIIGVSIGALFIVLQIFALILHH